jgi:hypothetical protein
MSEYLYHRGIHNFLIERKSKGLHLPSSQTDLQKLIALERPKFIDDIQKLMYNSIKKMLGYSSKYVKKQEEKRQRKASERRIPTDKFEKNKLFKK